MPLPVPLLLPILPMSRARRLRLPICWKYQPRPLRWKAAYPTKLLPLAKGWVLVLSVFFVDGQGAGAIDGYHVNVSPSNGPLYAQINSAGILTMIGLNEGVAVVEVTAIDGYDSNGSGDIADDDPSVVIHCHRKG